MTCMTMIFQWFRRNSQTILLRIFVYDAFNFTILVSLEKKFKINIILFESLNTKCGIFQS